MLRPALLLLACLIVQPALAPVARAQIQRCVDANGTRIYTDRACDAVGAVPQAAPEPAGGAYDAGFRGSYSGGFAIRGCARSPDALLDGVRGALEARDVNRLASYYHWTGVGTGSAKGLMDRLESISRHPLLAADLMYPSPPAPEPPAFTEAEPAPAPRGEPGRRPLTAGLYPVARAESRPEPAPTPAEPPLAEGAELPPPPPAIPHGIRVYQGETEGDFSARSTHFQLRRNAGCWWIQL